MAVPSMDSLCAWMLYNRTYSKYDNDKMGHDKLPFIDQILTVLSIPQLAMRYISEG